MLYLKSLATCRPPTALKRPDRSKQCHCLQFAESASLASCITTKISFRVPMPLINRQTIKNKQHPDSCCAHTSKLLTSITLLYRSEKNMVCGSQESLLRPARLSTQVNLQTNLKTLAQAKIETKSSLKNSGLDVCFETKMAKITFLKTLKSLCVCFETKILKNSAWDPRKIFLLNMAILVSVAQSCFNRTCTRSPKTGVYKHFCWRVNFVQPDKKGWQGADHFLLLCFIFLKSTLKKRRFLAEDFFFLEIDFEKDEFFNWETF